MLYSIGYATKPFETFVEQLRKYGVNAVADVRSVPFSKVFHDYHQTALVKSLPLAGINYVFLGDELGPRSKEQSHYDDAGQVQFDRLSESSLFRQGIARLQLGIDKGFSIALMCAEKDAATCHRSLLVGHYLCEQLQMELQHIDHFGELESQQTLERRLVDMHQLSADLLTDQEELLDIAFQRQLKQTSYRK